MSSSAHIATSSNGAVTHNSRENFSHSVVFTDELNECSTNTKEAFKIYRDELAIRSKAYSDRTHQSLQKNTTTKLSTVVNLEQHHTLKDLEPIVNFLEKRFDTKVFQVAIHRDEGKLISKIDGTELYSGKQFFKNPKDDKLYFDKKYTKEINLSDYTIQKNYHAHIECMGIDSNGKAIRHNQMHKHALKELQDITAKSLKMERTYSNEKRYDTHEFKAVGTVKQQEKKKSLATVKDLKEQMKVLRAELQTSGAKREDYALLEKHNAELLALIKAKELGIVELQEKIAALSKQVIDREKMLLEILPTAQTPAEVVQYVQELKKDLSEALQSKNELSEVNRTLRVEKMDLKGNQSAKIALIQELKNENESLKKENEKLNWYKKQYQAIVSSLKKWTKLDGIKAVMQNLKEHFEAPKAKIETVEEFEKALPLRSIHTATGKIRQELQASNEPEYLKNAKGMVLDEFEKQRLQAATSEYKSSSRVTLDDIRLAEQGYKEHLERERQKYRGPDLSR